MRTYEALELVEQALTDLKLPDGFGGKLVGLMAIGPVAKYAPEEWTQIENDFQNDSSPEAPQKYHDRAIALIERFKQEHTLTLAMNILNAPQQKPEPETISPLSLTPREEKLLEHAPQEHRDAAQLVKHIFPGAKVISHEPDPDYKPEPSPEFL